MSFLLSVLMALAGQTAPPPATTAVASDDATCFTVMAIASQSPEIGDHAKVTNVASGYYVGRLLARYPDSAALRAAVASGLDTLKTGDRAAIGKACMAQFAKDFARLQTSSPSATQ